MRIRSPCRPCSTAAVPDDEPVGRVTDARDGMAAAGGFGAVEVEVAVGVVDGQRWRKYDDGLERRGATAKAAAPRSRPPRDP
jgi:hypothetical protein